MGDEQRDLVGGDKPYASQQALDILRAKLTGGDVEGVFIQLGGVWRSLEDAIGDAKVMRGGNWEPATSSDITAALLGPADWDRNRVAYEREIYGGCSACSNRLCRDGDVCGRRVERPQARADSGD